MRQISLNCALICVSFLVIALSGCQALSMNGTSQIRNLAPLSSLKTELPGFVDGVINATANGCGGGGGPCLSVLTNNYLVITFDQSYQLDKIVFFVGRKDKETMGGQVTNLGGKTSRSKK